jgi:hypothetical protein
MAKFFMDEILILDFYWGKEKESSFILNYIFIYSSWDMLNNTWMLSEKLRPLITEVNFTQNGQVVFKTTSFAG